MSQAAILDQQDRRVLGGIVFVDAITGASIIDRLAVTSADLTLRPNRSGAYAIFNAPGFAGLTSEFIPVAADWPPNPPKFEIAVSDPSLRYVARRARVKAPQPLAAAFTPQAVPLYPGPSMAVAPNWAVVRASVTATNDGRLLPWTVLQVVNSDNKVIATGMTDKRGEGLLAVMGLGVQVSTTSGSVTEATTPVTVQAWFDPTALQQPPEWIPNPDDILTNLAASSLRKGQKSGALAPGQTLFAAISISL